MPVSCLMRGSRLGLSSFGSWLDPARVPRCGAPFCPSRAAPRPLPTARSPPRPLSLTVSSLGARPVRPAPPWHSFMELGLPCSDTKGRHRRRGTAARPKTKNGKTVPPARRNEVGVDLPALGRCGPSFLVLGLHLHRGVGLGLPSLSLCLAFLLFLNGRTACSWVGSILLLGVGVGLPWEGPNPAPRKEKECQPKEQEEKPNGRPTKTPREKEKRGGKRQYDTEKGWETKRESEREGKTTHNEQHPDLKDFETCQKPPFGNMKNYDDCMQQFKIENAKTRHEKHVQQMKLEYSRHQTMQNKKNGKMKKTNQNMFKNKTCQKWKNQNVKNENTRRKMEKKKQDKNIF